ncbi:MAG: type II toxin-antitoxin system VapC family toxin, partial [Dehalococcoidia bacterium]
RNDHREPSLMASYYFDSSALAKWYVVESGTHWVDGILAAPAANQVHTVRVTGVEVIAALALRVRTGNMTADDARTASTRVRADFGAIYNLVEVTVSLVQFAMALAEQHGLRGYDAVQLAAALTVQDAFTRSALPPITFVSADTRLNNVAMIEGLTVENPNDHS